MGVEHLHQGIPVRHHRLGNLPVVVHDHRQSDPPCGYGGPPGRRGGVCGDVDYDQLHGLVCILVVESLEAGKVAHVREPAEIAEQEHHHVTAEILVEADRGRSVEPGVTGGEVAYCGISLGSLYGGFESEEEDDHRAAQHDGD